MNLSGFLRLPSRFFDVKKNTAFTKGFTNVLCWLGEQLPKKDPPGRSACEARIKTDSLFLMPANRGWRADSVHRAGLWIKSTAADRECAPYRFVFCCVQHAGARTAQDSAGFFFFKHISSMIS